MRAIMIISRPVVVALVVLLAATSAHAVGSVHRFSEHFGPNPGVLTGNTLSGLAVGDLFGVEIDVTTNPGDAFYSLFTYLTYDPSALELVDGSTNVAAMPPDFASVPLRNQLFMLGAPEPAVGEPAGTAIGLAMVVTNFNTGNGTYNAVVAGAVVAFAQFKVLANSGTSTIRQVETGFSNIPVGGPIAFSGPLTVTVPEPSTALPMLLGLAGLGYRRRQA